MANILKVSRMKLSGLAWYTHQCGDHCPVIPRRIIDNVDPREHAKGNRKRGYYGKGDDDCESVGALVRSQISRGKVSRRRHIFEDVGSMQKRVGVELAAAGKVTDSDKQSSED